ncbi:MAG: tRNA uridine-5-carboxymethylaminomethyl(34) synthesis GTPase MnmE [Alphaproteobacteria bacterium]|nr:tRNA uridine-5-carboxymethylaminomethyl(34) synthesis GTPase MnmE [Alphaproteobacteria bacterium]
MNERATIFAPATAAGRAGLAVLRISGPQSARVLPALTRRAMPAPRLATRATIHDPVTHEPIDDGLVLWFPGPRSFTGEDVAELHVHGSRAVIAALLEALGRMPGLRLAEPGEFARRAFEAGKLDLASIEGLADLVAAETRAQARQALRQLQGEFGRRAGAWRERIARALAHAEAEIDFPDEDLPGGLIGALAPELTKLVDEIDATLADGGVGERLREGVQVAIIGAPNAGKSTLLNLLAKREAAIVSPLPGTTRDIVEVALDLGGFPAIVADTAGLRALDAGADGHAAIEAEGMRRARRRAEDADLRIAMIDAAAPDTAAVAPLVQPGDLIVVNKIDLKPALGGGIDDKTISVSLTDGIGIDGLMAALVARVEALCGAGAAAAPLITRTRHRAALIECRAALSRAQSAEAAELIAEDLRLAARAIGRIAGRVDVEDVLDAIFREFCIGK